MKILMVIYSLGSGGAERVLSTLANQWSEENNEVVIATFLNREPYYSLDSKIRHLPLGIDNDSINSKNVLSDNFFRIKTLLNIFKKENPDMIISFMTTANILSTIAAKLSHKPILISERTNYNFLQSKVWRLLRRVVYPLSDALVVQSNYDQKRYSFHNNCHVIYNPLKITHQHHDIAEEKIILAVGRLTKVKGFDLLIDAFANIKEKRGWKLIIVGEGSLREALQQQIDNYDLKSLITMPGNTKDVEAFYKRASIFVLSSRLEGFPNVLVEAMAYGCAPIAFDCLTGPRDIIDNQKNGLLVEIENVKALTNAMQILMDNAESRELYAENAKKIEQKLNVDKISDEWFEIINHIVNKEK